MKTKKSKLKIFAFCIVIFHFAFFILHFLPSEVLAAKKRIKGKLPTTVTYSSVRFRPDRRAIYVNFFNLGSVKQISYTLTYDANGVPQGVPGTIIPSGVQMTQRELLFGTCSKNVCTYHANISAMRLVVKTTTKSGKIFIKSYKIKP